MDIATFSSPTHDLPRIDGSRFHQLLKSKSSPATPEADVVYDTLVQEEIEPAFALAQFRVESQYGTSGYAKETGSWGNMLWDSNLCTHASGQITKITSSGHKYTYATYENYANAIADYINYLHWYRDRHGLDTIYEATARWLGRTPGSSGHVSYATTILDDIQQAQFPEGMFYDSGDAMIYAGAGIDRATGRLSQKLRVTRGTTLYRGTNLAAPLKKLSPATGIDYLDLFFLGPVNGSWEWGAAIVGTSVADPKGTIVYLYKPDPTKVISA